MEPIKDPPLEIPEECADEKSPETLEITHEEPQLVEQISPTGEATENAEVEVGPTSPQSVPPSAVRNRTKVCDVLGCSSSSLRDPDLLFIPVPGHHFPERRFVWLVLMRAMRDKKRSYCCSRHFQIPNDFKDFDAFVSASGTIGWKKQIVLKKGVVPHLNMPSWNSNLLPPLTKYWQMTMPATQNEANQNTMADRSELELRMVNAQGMPFGIMPVKHCKEVQTESTYLEPDARRKVKPSLQYCRLCFKRQDLEPIFTGDQTVLEPDLIDNIYGCTELMINVETDFPSSICSDCYGKVQDFVTFRKMVQRNDLSLRAATLPTNEPPLVAPTFSMGRSRSTIRPPAPIMTNTSNVFSPSTSGSTFTMQNPSIPVASAVVRHNPPDDPLLQVGHVEDVSTYERRTPQMGRNQYRSKGVQDSLTPTSYRRMGPNPFAGLVRSTVIEQQTRDKQTPSPEGLQLADGGVVPVSLIRVQPELEGTNVDVELQTEIIRSSTASIRSSVESVESHASSAGSSVIVCEPSDTVPTTSEQAAVPSAVMSGPLSSNRVSPDIEKQTRDTGSIPPNVLEAVRLVPASTRITLPSGRIDSGSLNSSAIPRKLPTINKVIPTTIRGSIVQPKRSINISKLRPVASTSSSAGKSDYPRLVKVIRKNGKEDYIKIGRFSSNATGIAPGVKLPISISTLISGAPNKPFLQKPTKPTSDAAPTTMATKLTHLSAPQVMQAVREKSIVFPRQLTPVGQSAMQQKENSSEVTTAPKSNVQAPSNATERFVPVITQQQSRPLVRLQQPSRIMFNAPVQTEKSNQVYTQQKSRPWREQLKIKLPLKFPGNLPRSDIVNTSKFIDARQKIRQMLAIGKQLPVVRLQPIPVKDPRTDRTAVASASRQSRVRKVPLKLLDSVGFPMPKILTVKPEMDEDPVSDSSDRVHSLKDDEESAISNEPHAASQKRPSLEEHSQSIKKKVTDTVVRRKVLPGSENQSAPEINPEPPRKKSLPEPAPIVTRKKTAAESKLIPSGLKLRKVAVLVKKLSIDQLKLKLSTKQQKPNESPENRTQSTGKRITPAKPESTSKVNPEGKRQTIPKRSSNVLPVTKSLPKQQERSNGSRKSAPAKIPDKEIASPVEPTKPTTTPSKDWKCPFCNNREFDEKKVLVKHLRKRHGMDYALVRQRLAIYGGNWR